MQAVVFPSPPSGGLPDITVECVKRLAEKKLTHDRIELFFSCVGRGYLEGLRDVERQVGPENFIALCKLTFNGTTALHEAARSGKLAAVRYVFDHGGAFNLEARSTKHRGGTPLLCSIASRNIETICFLLLNGADATQPIDYPANELIKKCGLFDKIDAYLYSRLSSS